MASKTITQLTALDTVSTNLANTLFVVYDTETGTTKKARSYSLVYRNGVVVVHDKPYPYVIKVKKQHPNAEIKPNY